MPRYWASLDVQCLNGTGASGQILGLLQTSGIVSVAASTITVAGIYPKIADLAQQISTNVGGLGHLPDKVFMHPRRWGFFTAALDSSNRPLMEPESGQGFGMNVIAVGSPSGYGGPVGRIQGLPVFLDANLPTTSGGRRERRP